MTTADTLRTLADVVDGLNDAALSVDGVETVVDDDSPTAVLTAEIRFELPDCEGGSLSVATPEGVSLDGESSGGMTVPLQVELRPDERVAAELDTEAGNETPTPEARRVTGESTTEETPADEPSAGEGTADEAEARMTDGGRADDEVASDEASETKGDADGTKVESDADEANPETPAHKDPARLREVYETCGTFAEMTEALGATVTAQTVRRNMIQYGIHEPSRQGTTGNAESESESRRAERANLNERETECDGDDGAGRESDSESAGESESGGELRNENDDEAAADERTVDLPSHVTLDDVRSAVADASTLYEVQRTLRIDRTKARKILQSLDLFELVGGRVATAEEKEESVAEIDRRIQNACA